MAVLEAREYKEYKILSYEANKQIGVDIPELHDVQVDSLKEHQQAIMDLKKRISALEKSIAQAENRFKEFENE